MRMMPKGACERNLHHQAKNRIADADDVALHLALV